MKLIVPAVIVFVIFTNFFIFGFNFYESLFRYNNTYQKFETETVKKEVANLKKYLIYGEKIISDFFNLKEKLHLKDVRNIIKFIIFFYCLLLLFIILFFVVTKNFAVLYPIGKYGILTSIILFLIFLFFDPFFLFMHLILFKNDYWILNPVTDNLIILFDDYFFKTVFLRIALSSFFMFLFIFILGKYLFNERKV